MKAKVYITSLFANAVGLFSLAITGILIQPIKDTPIAYLVGILAFMLTSFVTASMFTTVINSIRKPSTVDEKDEE